MTGPRHARQDLSSHPGRGWPTQRDLDLAADHAGATEAAVRAEAARVATARLSVDPELCQRVLNGLRRLPVERYQPIGAPNPERRTLGVSS